RFRIGGGARRHFVAAGAALVLLGGVACSAVSSFSSPAAPTSAPAAAGKSAAASQAAPAAVAGGGAAVAVNAMAPAPPRAANAQSDAVVADTSAQILDRMVIRTAQLTVEVPDIDQALAAARSIASRAGGFVSASNTHVERVNDQDRMVADLTLQVRS